MTSSWSTPKSCPPPSHEAAPPSRATRTAPRLDRTTAYVTTPLLPVKPGGTADTDSDQLNRSHSLTLSLPTHTVKDLNEINHLERSPAHSELLQGGSHSQQSSSTANNESLQDFRSRLNCRRKVKTRQVFYPGLEDDRTTDNSCDSATTKAHEDILRSANLLKQAEQTGEQTVAITRSMTRTTDQQQSSNLTKDDSFAVSIGGAAAGTTSTSTSSTTTKKAYLKEVQCTSSTSTSSSTTAASSSFGKRSFATTKKSAEGAARTSEESIL